MYFLYALLALCATVVGSLSGMGGGVIMKPLMDFMGHYESSTIGVLSSLTVFSMSLVSLLKGCAGSKGSGKDSVYFFKLTILSLGSVVGGFAGQDLYAKTVIFMQHNSLVTLIQNVCLLVVIVAVFFYMLCAEKIQNRRFSAYSVYLCAGLVLGVLSSFLGIGGGPINVALLMYLFSFDIKTATFVSLVTIFFAQIAKLSTVFFTGGFESYSLEAAPFMIVSAVAGGFIGTYIKHKVSERTVKLLFNCIQLFIMCLCAVNIAKSL